MKCSEVSVTTCKTYKQRRCINDYVDAAHILPTQHKGKANIKQPPRTQPAILEILVIDIHVGGILKQIFIYFSVIYYEVARCRQIDRYILAVDVLFSYSRSMCSCIYIERERMVWYGIADQAITCILLQRDPPREAFKHAQGEACGPLQPILALQPFAGVGRSRISPDGV